MAAAEGGVYSAEGHARHLRSAQPRLPESQIAARVRSAVGRLTFVAGHASSGVGVAEDGKFVFDPDAFDRYSRRGSERVDVRAPSHQTLAEQTEARAFTWLDRQLFGTLDARFVASGAVLPELGAAGQKRAAWLVAQGYAQQSTADPNRVELLPGAIRRLSQEEREAADRTLAERHRKPVVELPQGGTATETYGGVPTLHAGKRVVVVTEDTVFVAPVRRVPRVAIGGAGQRATARRTGARDSSVQGVIQPNQAVGTQLYLDGMEAGR